VYGVNTLAGMMASNKVLKGSTGYGATISTIPAALYTPLL
jgi:hypothetical protein